MLCVNVAGSSATRACSSGRCGTSTARASRPHRWLTTAAIPIENATAAIPIENANARWLTAHQQPDLLRAGALAGGGAGRTPAGRGRRVGRVCGRARAAGVLLRVRCDADVRRRSSSRRSSHSPCSKYRPCSNTMALIASGSGRCFECNQSGDLGWRSHRRDCHSADVPSTSLLQHLLKVEGGAAK